MQLPKRLLQSLLRILCGVPIVSLLGLGVLFALFSATWSGTCIGLSAVLLGALVFGSVGYWNRPWLQTRRRRLFTLILPASLVPVVVAVFMAPTGGSHSAKARNAYLGGQNRFCRWSPWNVVPEIDQLSVGLHLVPLGDPYVDFAKARRMRSLVFAACEQMEQDPEFQQLGSSMGAACRDLLHLNSLNGHYYLYVPETSPGERVPCLVFLHGMGGNIKPYFWGLSRISSRMKCVVVAPTFGFGLWQKRGGAELVAAVTREVIDTLPVDSERVFLMGYSQGAVGVTRTAICQPGLFRGLVYLSPITEDDLFETPEFSSQKGELRLLFLHGRRDLRIPCSFVEGTARILRQTGYDARLTIYEGEDHYLILSQQPAVLAELARFMTECATRTAAAD